MLFRILTRITAITLLLQLSVSFAAHAADLPLVNRGIQHLRAGRYVEAANLFEQGVADEDAACMNYLGELYLQGCGRIQSPLIAYGYFREAAARGNDHACRNLGNLYFNGRGVEVDLEKAAAWWKMSVEIGTDPRPAFSLGQLYWLGDGVPPRADLALEYWNIAKELGSKDAMVALAVPKGGDGNDGWDVETLRTLTDERISSEGGYRLVKLISNIVEDMNVMLDDGTTLPVSVVTAEGAMLFRDLMGSDSGLLVRDVPFVHQAHNFCVLASSSMLLRHQGIQVSQFDVADARSSPVTWHDEMVSVADTFGRQWQRESFAYTDEGYEVAKATLLEELRSGRAVVIDYLRTKTLKSAHTVVVCGYDRETGRYLVLNPNLPFPGLQVLSEKFLKATWRSSDIDNSELLRRIILDRGPANNQSATGLKARKYDKTLGKGKTEADKDLLLKNNSTFRLQITSNGNQEEFVSEMCLVLRKHGFRTEQWSNLADIQNVWGVSPDYMEGRITILHPAKKAFIGKRIAEVLRTELKILDVKMGIDNNSSSGYGVGVLIPSEYSQ